MRFKIVTISVIALSALILTGVFGLQGLLAQGGRDPAIVDKVAEELDVEADELRDAFKAVHEERMAEMKEQYEERLEKAVADGDITEQQKDTILEKREAIHKMHEELRELKRDLAEWVEENDIDPGLVSPGRHGKFPGHRGRHGPLK